MVVDAGGNIGSFALYAANKARLGRVVSLEPIEDNYRLLVANVALNRVDNVSAKRAALVAHQGPARVYLSSYGSGGHSLLRDLAQQSQAFEEVPGVTLEDVFDEYQLPRCDFLKLDCEGAEFEILQGLNPEVSRA